MRKDRSWGAGEVQGGRGRGLGVVWAVLQTQREWFPLDTADMGWRPRMPTQKALPAPIWPSLKFAGSTSHLPWNCEKHSMTFIAL